MSILVSSTPLQTCTQNWSFDSAPTPLMASKVEHATTNMVQKQTWYDIYMSLG